ncbi:MAG: hypothetical protein BGO20_17295 [Bosea sp. 67-29]|nr:MAG: hypothetical protein BGO20_17295 [Bosea sp. 67-29]
MADDFEAVSAGDLLLKLLDLLGAEFDDVSAFDIDQVVVMLSLGAFEAGTAIGEGVSFQDPFFLQEAQGPVDGRNRYAGIDRCCALVKFDRIWMIGRFRQNLHDDLTRTCQAKTVLTTYGCNVTLELHVSSIRPRTPDTNPAKPLRLFAV